MLLPKSNLQKVFGITVSVFFLCSLLLPVMSGLPGIQIQIEETVEPDIQRRAAALAETAELQARGIATGSVEKIISERLAEMGINDADIAIHITTNGQHEPTVESADITLDAIHEPQHRQIRAALAETLGFEVYLGYRETPQEEQEE
jgi:hypothetical protein